jgi:hypothetical protein
LCYVLVSRTSLLGESDEYANTFSWTSIPNGTSRCCTQSKEKIV